MDDILTIQIEWARRIVKFDSNESIETLNHLMNYLWGVIMKITTFDKVEHDRDDLISKMYDDDFYYHYKMMRWSC